MATSTASTKVVTGVVRLSFVHLLEPSEDLNGNMKYSAMVLIPKKDKDTIDKIHAAEKAALEAAIPTKFNGTKPKNLKRVFRDADEELDLDKYPEAEGHMFMNVSNKTKPGLVDENVQPVMDPGAVYSGVYARVSVNAFAYNAQGSKGLSFGLNNVMVLGYGEPLGGVGASAESDFADFADNDLL